MKILFCIGLLVFLNSDLIFSQEDSLFIQATLSSEIVNGKPTSKKIVCKQQLFNSKGLPLREIFIDKKTLDVSEYVVFFFKNGKMNSEEHFTGKDSLLYAYKYLYNKDGLKILSEKYVFSGTNMTVSAISLFNYKDSLLTREKEITAKKKALSITDYQYNQNQKLVSKKITYKKPFSGGIKEEKTLLNYNKNGLIDQMIITKAKTTGDIDTVKVDYFYNDKNQLAEELYSGENGNLHKKIYIYNHQGRLNSYAELDKEGNHLTYHKFDYQSKFMNPGINKSVFE